MEKLINKISQYGRELDDLSEYSADDKVEFYEDSEDYVHDEVEFSENDEVDLEQPVEEFQKEFNSEYDDFQKELDNFNEGYLQDVQDNINKEIDNEKEKFSDKYDKDAKLKDFLPGSVGEDGSGIRSEDFDDDDDEGGETNYVDDGDLTKFEEYLSAVYPSQIPSHDGTSVLGCENAMNWLGDKSSLISKELRNDKDSVLNIENLSEFRDNMLRDVILLKSHISKLKRKFKEENTPTASMEYDNLTKFAATPNNIVIAVSPFVRAITGILINSVVSAGKPFEEVYDYLLNKYDIRPREELEIMQTLMDMGQPIFKDRGTLRGVKEDKDADERLSGIDYITNYFA